MKIRIAVVVNNSGEWNSCGWSNPHKVDELMDIAVDGLDGDGEKRYWIEAEVDVPKPETVQGKAKLP